MGASEEARRAASGRGRKFVAFRVGQNLPRDVALAHIGGRELLRAEFLQARDQLRVMGR